MSYTSNFLKSKGQDCIINRLVPVNTKVSIKKSTNSSQSLGAREALWEGLIPFENALKSGEILTIKNNKYIVQTVEYDLESKENMFYCAKCNMTVQHKRYVETVDDDYNVIQEWQDVDLSNVNIPCYGEVVTYRLLQENPGLLEGTKYTFQIPKSLGVELLDRFVFEEKNYEVVSIDEIGLEGVCLIQLAADTRA